MSNVDMLVNKLRTDGGFTFDYNTQELVTKGFAVSANPELEWVYDREVTWEDLVAFVSMNIEFLNGDGVFGAWVDTETGKTYFDVVTVLDSEEHALDLAVYHKEIAIFDLASGDEIRVEHSEIS